MLRGCVHTGVCTHPLRVCTHAGGVYLYTLGKYTGCMFSNIFFSIQYHSLQNYYLAIDAFRTFYSHQEIGGIIYKLYYINVAPIGIPIAVLNLSKKGTYNPNLVWINKIPQRLFNLLGTSFWKKKDITLIVNNCFRFQDTNFYFKPFEKRGFKFFI